MVKLVKTPPFHGGSVGSNPTGVTKMSLALQKRGFAMFCRLLAAICFAALFCFSSPAADADSGLPVTSPFGWRLHPIYGDWRFHAGVDLGYEEGAPVNVLFAGEVVQSGNFADGYGNQVLVYHPDMDTYTRYAHLQAVYVTAGSWVDAGTIIGLVGATGNVTGPHLHLECIISDGEGGYNYTDPLVLWQ